MISLKAVGAKESDRDGTIFEIFYGLYVFYGVTSAGNSFFVCVLILVKL